MVQRAKPTATVGDTGPTTSHFDCVWPPASPAGEKVHAAYNSGAAMSGAEQAAEPNVMNPPVIHGLATPPTADCPAAQLVAAACGDGTVTIWDLDKV